MKPPHHAIVAIHAATPPDLFQTLLFGVAFTAFFLFVCAAIYSLIKLHRWICFYPSIQSTELIFVRDAFLKYAAIIHDQQSVYALQEAAWALNDYRYPWRKIFTWRRHIRFHKYVFYHFPRHLRFPPSVRVGDVPDPREVSDYLTILFDWSSTIEGASVWYILATTFKTLKVEFFHGDCTLPPPEKILVP